LRRKIETRGLKGRTFIRVDWPVYPLEEIIDRSKKTDQIHRVCISMITHPRAAEDTLYVIRRFAEESPLAISVLISPTLFFDDNPLTEMQKAGADRVGIAIDTATPQLFDRLRGRGIEGPHRWEHYWDVVEMAVEVFGKSFVGIHLIVGLGETERNSRNHPEGRTWGRHLFSFFPEKKPMKKFPRPLSASIENPAWWIINEGRVFERDEFDDKGRLINFGILSISPPERRRLNDLGDTPGRGWESGLQPT
jgi:biotin synthase